MPKGWWLAVCAGVWLAGADRPAVAEPASPRRHVVTVVRADSATRGLKADLPQASYGLGMALDAQERHLEAIREYARGMADLDGVVARATYPAAQVRAWRAKLAWQREESERILEQDAYARLIPTATHSHFQLARAHHGKFLSARAFLGEAPHRLWERARREYLITLTLDPRHAPARVGLARLYADAGMMEGARQQFAQVGARHLDDDMAPFVAGYWVALGAPDDAFAALARAVARGDELRRAQCSNDYDPLRDDPRFAPLVGEPQDPWRE